MKAKSVSDWVSTAFPSSQPPARPPVNKRKTTTTNTGSRKSRARGVCGKTTCVGSRGTSSVRYQGDGGDQHTPWVVKHSPTSIDDVAVHKKKVSDVQQWLEHVLSVKSIQHPVLLLSGPAGCGKTATLRAICHSKCYTLIEWSNALDVKPLGVGAAAESHSHTTDWELFESQTKQFHNFLLRASRYPSLCLSGAGGGDNVVLVEELPNAFYKDPTKLHMILRQLISSAQSCSPLVFIMSDTHHRDVTSSVLFPPSLITELNISTIVFNPVAHTVMMKLLERVANIECSGNGRHDNYTKSLYHMPSKELMETISRNSKGDIRCAINSLQFACLRVQTAPTTASCQHTSRSRRGGGDVLQIGGVGAPDTTLFLFRALGKILNGKRASDDDMSVCRHPLPAHLADCDRAPSLVDAELVFSSAHMSAGLFSLYLHQNYLAFYQDIDDVVTASSYLSVTDLLSSTWVESQEDRSVCEQCAGSLMTRGLLYANTHVAESRWRPLHKPQWTDVYIQYRQHSTAARQLFLHLTASHHSHLWTPVDLQTQILPYSAVINSCLRNPSQASLLHTITHFREGYTRWVESLGEKELLRSNAGSTGQSGAGSSETQTQTTDIDVVDTVSMTSSQCVTVPGDVGHVSGDESRDVEEIEDFDDDLCW